MNDDLSKTLINLEQSEKEMLSALDRYTYMETAKAQEHLRNITKVYQSIAKMLDNKIE